MPAHYTHCQPARQFPPVCGKLCPYYPNHRHCLRSRHFPLSKKVYNSLNCATGGNILKILLTNDDGIHAPGLWAAAQALARVGELFIVAPDREQSGVGAALTLHAPVKVQTIPVDGRLGRAAVVAADTADAGDGVAALHPVTAFSVEGTPGDSCILGLERLAGPVDLVVSGINSGSNLGWDVLVSGTVGAAWQGYVRGYPTIAISVGSVQNPRFDGAAALLGRLAEKLTALPAGGPAPPPGSAFPSSGVVPAAAREPLLLNVNVPSLPPEQIAGVEITRPGGRSYGEAVREEGIGHQKRYWIARNRPVMADNGPGTDMHAARNNRISITPMHLDLGHREQMGWMGEMLGEVGAVGQSGFQLPGFQPSGGGTANGSS